LHDVSRSAGTIHGSKEPALLRADGLIFAGMTAVSVAVLAVTGRFTPELTPDTAGYLEIHAFPAVLAQPRTPLYGWLVALLDLGRGSYVLVPAFQIVTYLAASWLFVAQLRRYGLSRRASLSVAATLLFANALFLVSHNVHPEFPAITCALIAFAGTVHLAAPQPRAWGFALVAAGTACAYVLRPSFLPLLVALPALFLCLRAMRGDTLAPGRAAMILLVAALPFAAIASLRAATVGDANIASFGGYVMSGMAILMLSDDVVARLPDDMKPFATEMLRARRAAEEGGRVIGIPLNASEIRSYHSAALAYFDVLARTHDDMLRIAASTLKPGESWVDFNRRLMRFSLAVLRAAPDRYAAWLVGATTRLIGRSLTTNLPAVLAIAVVAVAWPWRLLLRREVGVAPDTRLDFPMLILCALTWLGASGVLTVLIHAPANRFIDTASLLVAAPLIYWAALLLRPHAPKPAPEARA
jgi:hypothetical protein